MFSGTPSGRRVVAYPLTPIPRNATSVSVRSGSVSMKLDQWRPFPNSHEATLLSLPFPFNGGPGV